MHTFYVKLTYGAWPPIMGTAKPMTSVNTHFEFQAQYCSKAASFLHCKDSRRNNPDPDNGLHQVYGAMKQGLGFNAMQ